MTDGDALVERGRRRNPRGEGERLRGTLLEAAGELLAQVGDVDKLSVRAITARAGVTPTALYLHFDDKRALVDEIVRAAFEQLRAYVREADERHAGDPWEQLRAGCLAYVRFALDHPGRYRVIFQTRIPPADGPPSARQEAGLGAFSDLTEAVTRCLPAERDAHEVATLLWTAMHGRVTLEALMPGFPFPPLERHVDDLIRAHVGER